MTVSISVIYYIIEIELSEHIPLDSKHIKLRRLQVSHPDEFRCMCSIRVIDVNERSRWGGCTMVGTALMGMKATGELANQAGANSARRETRDPPHTLDILLHTPRSCSPHGRVVLIPRTALAGKVRGWRGEGVLVVYALGFGRSTPARDATLTTHQFTANGHQYW